MISKIIENLCLVQIVLVPKTKAASNICDALHVHVYDVCLYAQYAYVQHD